MVGRRCDGCHDVYDAIGWQLVFVSNTNYPNGGYWMRFHSFLCLHRWLDLMARGEDPTRWSFQFWLVHRWRGHEALAYTGDYHRLRFPAHGAHFGRRGGA